MSRNKQEIDILYLREFMGISKFKSIRRAIRRGDSTETGGIVPRRPFNNRVNTSKRKTVESRSFNCIKKQVYGELTGNFNK